MNKLRECIVNNNKYVNQKAIFHRWIDVSEIFQPSMMLGGHGGGVVRNTFALLELPDGLVIECYPTDIKFIDGGLWQNE